MSRSSLAKKLHLAKKEWKSFTTELQFKLHKLKTSKAIKTTTSRLLAMRFFRFLFPFKRHPLTKPSYKYSQYYNHHHHSKFHKIDFAAIHIDELFEEPATVHTNTLHAHAGTSKGKEVLDEKILPRKNRSIYSVEDAWEAAVASSPQLRGVDERAEEFISKFHEDVKLQKERSILEFQEMLARSA